MRVHLNIPDLLLSQIDARAELDAVDRTAVVCRLVARGLRTDEAHDRHTTGPNADQAHGVASPGPSGREADVVLLPPVEFQAPARLTRPTFGPLGGSAPSVIADMDDTLREAREANAVLLRKRAELGLDSTGLALEQAATRAAVQGTGPRPMGDLPAKVRAGKLDAGKVPLKGEIQ